MNLKDEEFCPYKSNKSPNNTIKLRDNHFSKSIAKYHDSECRCILFKIVHPCFESV